MSIDLESLISLGNVEKQTTKTKILFQTSVAISPQVTKKTFEMRDLRFFELLLSHQYKPSFEDIQLIEKMPPNDALAFLKLLKANGYTFTDKDCLLILSAYLSQRTEPRKNPLTKLNLRLTDNFRNFIQNQTDITDDSLEFTQKLIQAVCPDQQLNSWLFCNMFQHAYLF